MDYLDTDNPAKILYHQWRTILEYRRNGMEDYLRKQYSDRLAKPDGTGLSAHLLFQEMFSQAHYQSGWRATTLDYRMRLTVPALTSSHLDERLFDDMDDWEPVIRLNVYHGYNGSTHPIMTLWPDGRFYLDARPAAYHQIFPRWTFLRTSYAGGRRIWMPDSPHFASYKTGWVHFDTADFTNPIPYVRNYDLKPDEFYTLEPDMTNRGYWRFAVDHSDGETADRLQRGYQAAQRRYDRARKKVEDAEKAVRTRNTVSIYVPQQGYLANADAVKHFSSYLKVHERT